MASAKEANTNSTRRIYKKSVKRRNSSVTAPKKRAAKKKTPRPTKYRTILDPANPPTHDILTPENIRAAIRAVQEQ